MLGVPAVLTQFLEHGRRGFLVHQELVEGDYAAGALGTGGTVDQNGPALPLGPDDGRDGPGVVVDVPGAVAEERKAKQLDAKFGGRLLFRRLVLVARIVERQGHDNLDAVAGQHPP